MDLHSPRLALHPIDPAEAQAIIDGSGREGTGPAGGAWHRDYPLHDELDPLQTLAGSIATHSNFTMYQIRLSASDTAIGGIGFFGPPDDNGAVELGFGLVESERGKGFATEALVTLVELAASLGARSVKADTSLDNIASQRVLLKAGFIEQNRAVGLVFYSRDLNR